jgi:hypothetical protein
MAMSRIAFRFGRRVRAICATLAALATFGVGAQPLTQDFDDITTLAGAGWVLTNNSTAGNITGWFQGNSLIFPSQAGAAGSYIGANFLNAGLSGNVSNWLISPNLPALQNGETLSFYSRSAGPTPDRLEVRLCTGALCTNVGTTDTSVGNFTTLLLAVNPTQTTGIYPNAWTHYSITLSGLPAGPTQGRIAFRYFITDTTASGNYIGIDTFTLSGAAVAPVLQSVASRRVHGAAGPFDLPLLVAPAVNHNPTTEPRQGPAQTIVFTFDKPVNAATASVTEGTATPGAVTFSGNSVIVPLTGVTDIQYVTVAVSGVASTDGGTGGSGSVRIGFLLGDVNQTRVVSVADVGLVNAQLAQSVTATNFLKDVNVTGTLTVADKAITNAALTKALPTP